MANKPRQVNVRCTSCGKAAVVSRHSPFIQHGVCYTCYKAKTGQAA